MALTPILGIQQVATNQSNKEATINDAILALEGAGNGTLTLDYSTLAGDYMLSESLFSRNFLFKPTSQPSGVTAITLHLPRTVNGHAIQRIFAIQNASTAGLTVFIAGAAVGTSGATGLLLPEGSSRLLAMDGDNIIIASEATTASRFIDLTDVPPTYEGRKGLTYRVKQDETGLEFVDGLSVEELSDTDVTAKTDGSILRYNGTSAKWVATPLSLVNTFLGLGDTPKSFTGKGSYLVHVNAAENSLEFVDPLTLGGPVTGGGNTGEVLTKHSATEGDYGWEAPGLPLPVGGAAGQYLKKTTVTDGDAAWTDLPPVVKELPDGGTANQILAKISNANGAVEWVDAEQLQQSYAPAVVNSVAVSLLDNDRFTLPWVPTKGNALIVGYFSNVAITAASGWVELGALAANSWWNGAKTFGRIVQTGDSQTITPCNVGTSDAAVVFEIDMRYLAGGLAGLAPLMGYSDTAVPEVHKVAASVIIAGTAHRAGSHPVYTVTGSLFNTAPPLDDTAGGNRYAGGVYIDPAAADATVDIAFSMGTDGSAGVYFYIVVTAITSEIEEAPTDGQRYVRTNKIWAAQGPSLPTGGVVGQILTKNSSTDGDASWKIAPAGVPTGGTTSQVLAKSSSTAGDYTWKTVGFVPTGGSTGMVLTKNSNTDLDVKWAAGPLGLPTGGAIGTILVKTGAGDGAVAWGSAPHELPTGGSTNQYLVKNSTGDYDTIWKSGPSGVPVGGTVGQILTKNSSTDGDISWKVAPSGVPAGGSTGQILTKASATDGDVSWQAPPVALPVGGTTGQILTKASGTNGDAVWGNPAIGEAPMDSQLYARINGGWQSFLPDGGTGGGDGGTTIVRPHRFWRLNVSANDGSTATAVAEIVLRTEADGVDQATGGTAIGNFTDPANAFDQNAATEATIASSSGAVGYDFGANFVKGIMEVQIWAPADLTKAPKDFQVQYSDDGAAWNTAWAVTGQTAWTAAEQRTFTDPDPDYVTATYVLEAPTDGNSYVRKNGTWAAEAPLPTGGGTGQILTKNSATDGDAAWEDAPEGIPTGGHVGQVLTKATDVTGDVAWQTPVRAFTDLSDAPNTLAGQAGKLVRVKSDSSALELVANAGVPAGGIAGQVLTKISTTDGDATWLDPDSGTEDVPAPHAYWRVWMAVSNSGSFLNVNEIEFRSTSGAHETATGGTPLGGTIQAGFPLANAFDGNTTGAVAAFSPIANTYIGYEFAEPKTVLEVAIYPGTAGQSPKTFWIEWSDDGATWTKIGDMAAKSDWASGVPYLIELIPQKVTEAPDDGNLYARKHKGWTDINAVPDGGTAGQILTKNTSTDGDSAWETFQSLPNGGAPGQVLIKQSATNGDAAWGTPPIPGNGPGAFPYWRVSIITGDGQCNVASLEFRDQEGGSDQAAGSGGTATASSLASGSAAANAFDGDGATFWTASAATYPQSLSYHFPTSVEVRQIAITTRNDASYRNAPLSGAVQYSFDGTTWTQAYTFITTDDWAQGETRLFNAAYHLSLRDLGDIDLSTAPTQGQALVYSADEARWIPGTVAGGGDGDDRPGPWVVEATGTGTSQVIVLPVTATVESVLVFVNGLRYSKTEYTVVDAALTLTTNDVGDSIEVVGVINTGDIVVSSGGGQESFYSPPKQSDFQIRFNGQMPMYDHTTKGLFVNGGTPAGGDIGRGRVKVAPQNQELEVTAHLLDSSYPGNWAAIGVGWYNGSRFLFGGPESDTYPPHYVIVKNGTAGSHVDVTGQSSAGMADEGGGWVTLRRIYPSPANLMLSFALASAATDLILNSGTAQQQLNTATYSGALYTNTTIGPTSSMTLTSSTSTGVLWMDLPINSNDGTTVPLLRGSTIQSSAGTSWDVSIPVGSQPGDYCVIAAMCQDHLSIPDGWEVLEGSYFQMQTTYQWLIIAKVLTTADVALAGVTLTTNITDNANAVFVCATIQAGSYSARGVWRFSSAQSGWTTGTTTYNLVGVSTGQGPSPDRIFSQASLYETPATYLGGGPTHVGFMAWFNNAAQRQIYCDYWKQSW